MKREIIKTGDGSTTIHLPDWDEHYHSKHGAIQEAIHVFINTGLHHYINTNSPKNIEILEIGFGTGLNAFLTVLDTLKSKIKINYTGIEAFPVSSAEIDLLNFPVSENEKFIFNRLHSVDWESSQLINEKFNLKKVQSKFEEINDINFFDLIYFDAFGARVQPELWTEEIFEKMYTALKSNGVLVTYAAKGSVRRAMQSCGFLVEKLPGPPGKREMLRATKN